MKYELGKIYNEDCISGMKKMPDGCVDITLTSPPYNVGKAITFKTDMYEGYSDDLSHNEYYIMIKTALTEMLRVTRHHVFLNFQKLSNNRMAYHQLLYDFRHKIKEEFIWAKRNPAAPIHPHVTSAGFEYIICFSNEDCSVRNFKYCNFNNRDKTSGKLGIVTVSNCIIETENRDNLHPGIHACFPLWLPNYFIRYFSNENDIIFDPFMGSGTTAVVAKKLNRRFFGFELDKERCEYANERIKNVPENNWF